MKTRENAVRRIESRLLIKIRYQFNHVSNMQVKPKQNHPLERAMLTSVAGLYMPQKAPNV